MEMNQIRYFLAVCKHGNFSHAARALDVSQPSLTTAIKKLECELGGLLILRNRAGCRLTPLGAIVHPRLQDTVLQIHQAELEAARHVSFKRAPIGVGVGETIGQSRISQAIELYRKRNPEADIELIVDHHAALLEGLREGRFDIAVTVAQASEELYQIDVLYEERYCAVVASAHALAQRERVNLELLAGNEMLDRLNCEMREFILITSADRGCELYAAYRSNGLDWLLELARNGTGFLVLPETAVPNEKGLVKLEIEGVGINREVSVLRWRHQPLRPGAHDLVQELIRAS